MLITIERVLVLKSVSVFAELADEALVELASVMSERSCAAGETLIAEGELSNTLFVIVEGQVEVIRNGRLLARIGEREVVGELAALDPEPRSATVRTTRDAHLLELSHGNLDAALMRNAELMRGVIRMLCRRLRSTGVYPVVESDSPELQGAPARGPDGRRGTA